MLALLENEIRIAMALSGVSRIGALDRSYVMESESMLPTHVWGAFPLLDESLSRPPAPLPESAA